MKQILCLTLLSLALLACSDSGSGEKGAPGIAGKAGATGPAGVAGKDATEWFIFFNISGDTNVNNEIKERPIKVASDGKSLNLTKQDCVRLKSSQVSSLVISLPEVKASPPPTAILHQPAVTVCDNTNKIGGTDADKDQPKTDDDCPLYLSTYIYKDTRRSSATASQLLGEFVFADFGLNSVQQAKCKTI